MTITRRIAFGAAASWFSRGVTILLGLVLLPILFRYMPKEELGIWLLFGQSWVALGIFDLGFGVTLTRRIAFAVGKNGAYSNGIVSEDTLEEIADLVRTARRIYSVLAITTFLLSFIGGLIYLSNLGLNSVAISYVSVAWALLCLGQAFGLWAAVWTSLLQGIGYVGWDSILASFVNALTIVAHIISVLLGGGIVTLAFITVLGAVAQRLLILCFASHSRPELFRVSGRWNRAIFDSMLPLALRAWLTALGAVVLTQSDLFFVAGLSGAEEIPGYRAAYLVLTNLNMLSVTFAGASAVFISHLWQARELAQVHGILLRNLRLGLGLMACGGALIMVSGKDLFQLWLGNGNFVGYPLMTVFFVTQFLDAQAYIIVAASRATEDEAFAIWSLSAGALKLIFSAVLAPSFGFVGIALGTIFAQLLTTHWVMTHRGLKRLKFSISRYMREILLPVTCVFSINIGFALGVVRILQPFGAAGRLSGVSVATCLVFACFSWWIVLTESEREKVLSRIMLDRTQVAN